MQIVIHSTKFFISKNCQKIVDLFTHTHKMYTWQWMKQLRGDLNLQNLPGPNSFFRTFQVVENQTKKFQHLSVSMKTLLLSPNWFWFNCKTVETHHQQKTNPILHFINHKIEEQKHNCKKLSLVFCPVSHGKFIQIS